MSAAGGRVGSFPPSATYMARGPAPLLGRTCGGGREGHAGLVETRPAWQSGERAKQKPGLRWPSQLCVHVMAFGLAGCRGGQIAQITHHDLCDLAVGVHLDLLDLRVGGWVSACVRGCVGGW